MKHRTLDFKALRGESIWKEKVIPSNEIVQSGEEEGVEDGFNYKVVLLAIGKGGSKPRGQASNMGIVIRKGACSSPRTQLTPAVEGKGKAKATQESSSKEDEDNDCNLTIGYNSGGSCPLSATLGEGCSRNPLELGIWDPVP